MLHQRRKQKAKQQKQKQRREEKGRAEERERANDACGVRQRVRDSRVDDGASLLLQRIALVAAAANESSQLASKQLE